MKKIWPWLLLLLLLIIFCVISKKDTIHISSTTPTQSVTTQVIPIQTQHINYVITQKGTKYSLNGNFTNMAQEHLFVNTFLASEQTLEIENTSVNKTLLGNDIVELTNKILPHFIANYSNGKIYYANQILKVSGNVNSYENQHEMQRLLNTSKLATQDNSNVIPPETIHFIIRKYRDEIEFSGTFTNKAQVALIKSKLPTNTTTEVHTSMHYRDIGVLSVIEKTLPTFLTKYKTGKISYQNEILNVSGMVATENDLSLVTKLFSSTHDVKIINKTTIDKEAIARAKKRAAVLMEKKAEKARLAVEKEIKLKEKAKLAAKKQAKLKEKAKLAVLRAQEKEKELQAKIAKEKAALDAKLKAQAEEKQAKLEAAKKVAQAKLAAKTAKENIIKLLKIENIEFNTNKSTLTDKGLSTVNKLADILKKYPTVSIEIAGHTDSDGREEYNHKLSQSRVDMVKNKLIENGVALSRLIAVGYGETSPLVPNTTDENKAKNRRVEINIQGE